MITIHLVGQLTKENLYYISFEVFHSVFYVGLCSLTLVEGAVAAVSSSALPSVASPSTRNHNDT